MLIALELNLVWLDLELGFNLELVALACVGVRAGVVSSRARFGS